MSDQMVSTGVSGSGAVSPDEGARNVKKTRTAVYIGAGAAFVLIVGLVAAMAYFFLFPGVNGEQVTAPVAPDAVTTPSAEPAPGEPAVEPVPVPLTEVFTFRDVFQPLIQPLPEPAATTTPTPDGQTAPTDTVAQAEGTLTLEALELREGSYVALVVWNGVTHTLSPGGQIPGTPWQLVSASATEAVMLYGDFRHTLTVGASITK